jgi:peptidoglycan/xylan/chitin deacetylase (PgdA/CDA1 family)
MNGVGAGSPVKAIRGLVGLGFDVVRAVKRAAAAKGADPVHCYEHWLEVEAQVGARSTFFFWPGWKAVVRRHASDCLYDMEDRVVFDEQRCTVAEMIREIDRRGWEIGLHPSWYSFDDEEEMKRQKAALEEALGHEVVSVRQHYLHYDIRVTPRVQAAAGFKYDATLGFNDNVGFRFGTCYPWRLWDLETEKELPIVEVPLIIQDGAMLNPAKGMRLDEETSFQYVKQIATEVERVGGVLTLLWHPNSVANKPWWNLYCRSLVYLKEKQAFFAPIRELAEATNCHPIIKDQTIS